MSKCHEWIINITGHSRIWENTTSTGIKELLISKEDEMSVCGCEGGVTQEMQLGRQVRNQIER